MSILPKTIVKGQTTCYADELKVGECVYSGDGKLDEIVKVNKKFYNGDIFKVKFWGALKIELTPEHVLQVTDGEQVYFKTPSELDELDYLYCPKTQLIDSLPMPNWVLASRKIKNNPNKIDISDDMAYLVGIYVTDGNAVPGHKIVITLGGDEHHIVEKCVKSLKVLGLIPTVKYYETFIRVIAYSSIVSRSFSDWFGKEDNKRLPNWVLTKQWNLNKILEGLDDGDGSKTVLGNAKRVVNTSKHLIYQCHTILLDSDELPYLSVSDYKHNYPNFKPCNIIEWTPKNKRVKKSVNKWVDNKYLLRFSKIKTEPYSGFVYDIKLKNGGPCICNGMTVNCSEYNLTESIA